MTDKIVIFSTCASRDEADRVATALLEKRLAACVSILPAVDSVYRWQGAVERSQEILLMIKSSRRLFDALRAEIIALHSYEIPEVIAVPIVAGAAAYLGWLDRELDETGENTAG